MKKTILYFFCLGLWTSTTILWGQTQKPKVALVLSGGGAKGVAHIPLLQTLDSLGIVPDLIVGTSMGSIVGGLYAMGYSGDSIAKIAKTVKWNELLGGKISLNNVSVEEMGEFDRYLIDIDVKNYKPKIKPSLLNDQNLREFLAVLTNPVYHVTNFDELTIPYRAVATDILNGKLVTLDEGSLALAMRASMSIPGAFSPIFHNNTVLVDGGLLDNFPTDIAKKMGADIIIGSDVGDEKVTAKDLENLSNLLFQATMLTSNLKNEDNKKLCDILLSHFPNLTYSTGDFGAANEIYNQGKVATNQNLSALIALANQLKPYKNIKHTITTHQNSQLIDSIVYKNISKANLNLVEQRSGLAPFQNYTVNEIADGARKAMGTNLFNQIYFSTTSEKNKNIVTIEASEYYKHQIKASLHFDTFRGFGAIVNYTGRNLLGESSRILITGDIAQQPRLRVQYQKIFSKDKSWWWRSELYTQSLTQDVYIDNKKAENILFNGIVFENQINKNINFLKSYFGFSLDYNYTHLRPKTGAEFNNRFFLSSYYLNLFQANVYYSLNNLNKVFFATNGNKIEIKLSRSLIQDIDYNLVNTNIPNFSGALTPFTQFSTNYEARIPLDKNTLILGANAGFTFEDSAKGEKISATIYGYTSNFFLGGYFANPIKRGVKFMGLQENEVNPSQFIKGNIGLQTHLTTNIYLIPHCDFAILGFKNFNEFSKNFSNPKGEWQNQVNTSLLLSGGATVSFDTFLGPILFDASWINNKKIKAFFNIGFVFNPSL
ncbi:patatin-like phospholipase family protein [Flavobacterium sp. RSSA_27]|uniref:patatin-like phospholipase family protein n=1 Tax=Flavobacterium sp. RSSA_27 TaxID=3447667 RepID=UPI003F407752